MNYEEISKHIVPDFVIDVGANVGQFYQESKWHWPHAKYFLIEGNPECQPMLQSLSASYAIALLSDRKKTVTFYTRKDAPTCTGCSIYREDTEFYAGDKAIPQERETATLDEIVCPDDFARHKFKTLLKLDVQGSELDILRGGEKVLENCGGVIIEEQVGMEPYNIGAPHSEKVNVFMVERGWNCKIAVGDIVHPITRKLIQRDYFYPRPPQ